jgi:hypothetical protein
MATTRSFSSDVAFTPAVKAIQIEKGSRGAYARMEERGGFGTKVDDYLAAFVAEQTSFFLASANAEGQPYIQHRGGPPGFFRVIDDGTLGFADYSGNRQFITLGNLVENPRVHVFLIDYMGRRRVKIWGEARVVEDDPVLLESLTDPEYKAQPERALLIHVTAWDRNCPQHIPQRFEAEDVKVALGLRDRRIAELEAEIVRLRDRQ